MVNMWNPGGMTPQEMVEAAQMAAEQGGTIGLGQTGLTYTGGSSTSGIPEWLMQDPETAGVILDLIGLGYNQDYIMSALQENSRQADMDNAYKYWALSAQAAADQQRANTSAGAARAAAQASADAARHAADQALAAAQMDNETKLKISAAEIAQRARETEAKIRAQGPYSWVEGEYYKHPEYLQGGAAAGAGAPTAGGLAAQTAAAQPAANPWAAALGGPSAIVGEQGPEIATAMPGGTQITPLRPRPNAGGMASIRGGRGGGLPRMALGGFIPGSTGPLITPPRRSGATDSTTLHQTMYWRTPQQTTTARRGTSYNRLSAQGAGAGYGTDYNQYAAGYDPSTTVTRPSAEALAAGPRAVTSQQQLPGYQRGGKGSQGILREAMAQGAPWAVRTPTFSGGVVGPGGTNPAAPGFVGPGGEAPTGMEAYQNLPWLQALQGNTPMATFGGWNFPAHETLGIGNVPAPYEVSLPVWNSLSPDAQQEALGLWTAHYGITPEEALTLIQRAGFGGTGGAMTGWG